VEDSTPISRRIAFDEAPIAQQAICGQGRVLLQSPVAGYDPFEQLIVLFKMLCAQSHPGSWLFTSIALNQPLSRQAALSVTRTQMVLGRMVEAVLSQNDVPAGRIQMVRSATGGAT
jgi:phage terminase large subunit-like protein